MADSVTLSHGPCPRCLDRGMDTSGDNLVTYSDGHQWCFGCHYYRPPTLRLRLVGGEPIIDPKTKSLHFPEDYTKYLGHKAVSWLGKYSMTHSELIKHRLGWSDSKQMLVMPVFGEDNNLLMWQGRNFGETPFERVGPYSYRPKKWPKYVTFGEPSDILHIINPNINIDTIILTEDLISAIKVGRVYPAMPLWGSHIPMKGLLRLKERFKHVGIWLDPDKRLEAVKTALRASQITNAFVVPSDKDPKEYNAVEIKDIVREAQLA